jgi:type I restriction enzyme, R subunit
VGFEKLGLFGVKSVDSPILQLTFVVNILSGTLKFRQDEIAYVIELPVSEADELNPKYYDRMSELLDALLEERRKEALDYKAYLAKLLQQASQLGRGEGTGVEYPDWANSGARRALYDFFIPELDTAIAIDRAIRHSKPDSWVGNAIKEKKVKRAIAEQLPSDFDPLRLEELFELVRARNEYR